MSKRALRFAVLTGSILLTAAVSFGGWAVITVDDLPAELGAGRPVRLAFTVRQHGIRLFDGLTPTVSATDENGARIDAAALPSGGEGNYFVNLTVPRTGRWTIAINSGFMSNSLKLLPIIAVRPDAARPAPEPAAAIGRRLFVAKGCVSCHVHRGVEGYRSAPVGPDLTHKRYQADYLARWLANPSAERVPGQAAATPQKTMPNLGLKRTEVAALVAFINADRPNSAGNRK